MTASSQLGNARRLAVVACGAAVLPIVVAAVRATARGWRPVGDPSYSAVRAWDAFSTHPPLLGTWSPKVSTATEYFNHPGPLQFDLLAVPVRLLGHGPGTALGMAALNATAVVLICWLVARQHGPSAAALAMAGCAVLAWSLGSESLFDASPREQLYPLVLYVVAVWAAVAGDKVAPFVAIVAGSYLLQTHLTYSILVPGLAVFAVIGSWRHVAGRWPHSLRWVGAAAGVGLVCWLQPLVEQVGGEGEGNLTALVRSVQSVGHDDRTPTAGQVVRLLGGTLAVPPAWLPPSFGDPSFRIDGTGVSTVLAAVGLVGMAVALVALGWRAFRRDNYPLAAACGTGLVALVLAFLTAARTPLRAGLAADYFRWLWPLGMVLWLVLALAIVDELRAAARLHERIPRLRMALAPVALAAAAVAGIAAMPTVDNGSGTQDWQTAVLDDIDDDVLAAVEGHEGVLVEFGPTESMVDTAPGVFVLLQKAGVPFYVASEPLVRQLGSSRRYSPGRADLRLHIRHGPDEKPRYGERLVAVSSPLTAAEREELADLDEQVEDLVARHGLPVTPNADAVYTTSGQPDAVEWMLLLAGDPAAAIEEGAVLELWDSPMTDVAGHPLLDETLFPTNVMDRWSALESRRQLQTVKVFASGV